MSVTRVVRLRQAEVEALDAAAELRPGAAPADVREEVIRLGLAALRAGWRVEAARVVVAPGEPS